MIANAAWRRVWGVQWLWAVVLASAAALIVMGHLAARSLPTSVATPLVVASHLFALLLGAAMLALAAGVGSALLDKVALTWESRLERCLFAVTIGLGAIAYAVLGLGLAGLLQPASILGVLVVLAVIARHEILDRLRDVRGLVLAVMRARRALRSQDRVLGLAIPIADLLLIGLVIEALAPPMGYDALMYHLLGPKRFLELGRIAVLPDVQQANMPMTVDMLYTVGLAFGSDELAAVIHLAMALFGATTTFAFARRFVGERVAWIAPIIFLSTSMIWLYAPNANIDYGLALFDVMAVFAVTIWAHDRQPRWLLVAGALGGLCLGTKYLGATTVGLLGLFVLTQAIRSRARPAEIVRLALLYGLPALIVASPWYIKNWLWLGSPVWPLLRTDSQDFNIAITPNVRYGTGLLDYLLIPYYLYVDGSLEFSLSRPPILFLLLPLYLLLPRHRVVTGLLIFSAVQYAVWTQTAHVLRYLTPIMAELSIGAAFVVAQLGLRPTVGRAGRQALSGLVVLGLLLTLAATLNSLRQELPFAQLVGLESKRDFLDRSVQNHRLVSYLNDKGSAVQGVLLLGDRRGFYSDTHPWVDVSLKAFETLAMAPTPEDARTYLRQIGVDHVLLGESDLAWHAQFDTEGRLVNWWEHFQATKAAYLVPEATSGLGDLTLYRVTAPGEDLSVAAPPIDLD
jgi:hypothetical protein